MSYTINYEGDSTEHLAAFISRLAASGQGAWCFELTLRDELGDPADTGDVGIVDWHPIRGILRVRPWPEGQPEFPEDDQHDIWVHLDRIAELKIY